MKKRSEFEHALQIALAVALVFWIFVCVFAAMIRATKNARETHEKLYREAAKAWLVQSE